MSEHRMYHPEELYTTTNKKQTFFEIRLRGKNELLWSGPNLKSAEAWLSRHLIPPKSVLALSPISKALADAFPKRR